MKRGPNRTDEQGDLKRRKQVALENRKKIRDYILSEDPIHQLGVESLSNLELTYLMKSRSLIGFRLNTPTQKEKSRLSSREKDARKQAYNTAFLRIQTGDLDDLNIDWIYKIALNENDQNGIVLLIHNVDRDQLFKSLCVPAIAINKVLFMHLLRHMPKLSDLKPYGSCRALNVEWTRVFRNISMHLVSATEQELSHINLFLFKNKLFTTYDKFLLDNASTLWPCGEGVKNPVEALRAKLHENRSRLILEYRKISFTIANRSAGCFVNNHPMLPRDVVSLIFRQATNDNPHLSCYLNNTESRKAKKSNK